MIELVVASKRYSSWSMRPFVALAHTGAAFSERLIELDQPDTAARIAEVSPAGRLPALLDEGVLVWDSLAICEYLAEKFPQARLWPADPSARAQARAACAEMHSGFSALRNALPMKILPTALTAPPLSPEAQGDLRRVTSLWADLRARWGKDGPYLFGHFTNADAFYAPVAIGRFQAYGVELPGPAQAYVEAVAAHPGVKKWVADAKRETHRVSRYG